MDDAAGGGAFFEMVRLIAAAVAVVVLSGQTQAQGIMGTSCVAAEIPAALADRVMTPSAAQRLMNEIAKLSPVLEQQSSVIGALVLRGEDVVRILWQKPGFMCSAVYERGLFEKAHRAVFGGEA